MLFWGRVALKKQTLEQPGHVCSLPSPSTHLFPKQKKSYVQAYGSSLTGPGFQALSLLSGDLGL